MILINLLPHREAARKRRKEIFFVLLGLCIFIFSLLISDQESFVDFDDSEMVVPRSQGLVKASQGTVFSDSLSRSVLRKPFTGKIVFGSYFFIF